MTELFDPVSISPSVAEAQRWWDAIPDRALFDAYSELAKAVEKRVAPSEFRGVTRKYIRLIADIRAAPCPASAEIARDYYVRGWTDLATALVLIRASGNSGTLLNVAFQKIGHARGFLHALGVTLWDAPNARIFFK